MSDNLDCYDIKKIDFSQDLSKDNEKTHKIKTHKRGVDQKKRFPFHPIKLVVLVCLSSHTGLLFIRKFITKFKRKASRSLFFGRGVYFKIFSNITLFFILLAGFFIYSSKTSNGDDYYFFSRFSGVTKANETVLYAQGGESVKTTKKISPKTYKVADGDTLLSIAKKFSTENNKISVDSIKWANNITSDFLDVGSEIVIPPIDGTLHKVEEGEDLADIAVKNNKLSEKDIEKANKGDEAAKIKFAGFTQELVDINLLSTKVVGNEKVPQISAGQTLIIPGGSVKIEEPEPTPTPEPVLEQPAVASLPQPTPEPVIVQPPPEPAPPQPVITDTSGWPVIGGRGIISQYYSGWHTAVDIADFSGPALVAILPGQVITSGWETGGCGNVVRIQHDNGYVTTYCHTAYQTVGVGQRVSPGQVVAYMGCTGTCTGTHVHFMLQLTPGGGYVNPLGYISR